MRLGTQIPVTCDECGESGEAINSETVAASWIKGRRIVHTDKQVCIDNLKKKMRPLKPSG